MGHHPNGVVASTGRAEEAVGGDLQGVAVGEKLGQIVLIQQDLSHSLAIGALSHQQSGAGVPEGGGNELGGAGGLAVGQHDEGGVGQLGHLAPLGGKRVVPLH